MDVFWLLLCSLSLCIFVSAWAAALARRLSLSKSHLPPGPRGIPVVGSLFALAGKKPHQSLADLAKIHGPLMTLQLGYVTTVVVSSAGMAREVLQKNDQNFSGRMVIDVSRVLNYHEGSMVLGQPNHRWRMLRRISSTELFSEKKLNSLQGLRQRAVGRMIEQVRESCDDSAAVDIGCCAFTTVLNLISNMIFSESVVDPQLDSAKEWKDLIRELLEIGGTPNAADYFPLLKLIDPQGLRRRTVRCFTKLYSMFDEKINQRLQSRSSQCPKANDLLDVLLDLCEDANSGFSLQHIKPFLLDIFVAGSETISSTVEWAMAELLRNGDALAKAQVDIAERMGGRGPGVVSEADVGRLAYLQAVVKETVRLHPPVPLLVPHRAEAAVELGGYTVPKHAQVIVNAWAISRDGGVWEKPAAFVPERFLESHVEINFKGSDFDFIPFGAGRRICPGMSLASRVVPLILASLLHFFDWRLPAGETAECLDMGEKFGNTLHKATPLLAIPCHLG